MPPRYTWFKPDEVAGLDPDLCAMLDLARGRAGVPFIITSGRRTPDHNTLIGGKSDSTHLKGLAADLKADDSTRFKIVKALMDVGFRRIEVSKDGHCHCDIGIEPEYVQDWLGIE